jgi:hypothetical protein
VVKASRKAAQNLDVPVKEEISDISSNIGNGNAGLVGRKRGRKREKDNDYFLRAQDKINEIRQKLKTAKQDGMDVKER